MFNVAMPDRVVWLQKKLNVDIKEAKRDESFKMKQLDTHTNMPNLSSHVVLQVWKQYDRYVCKVSS